MNKKIWRHQMSLSEILSESIRLLRLNIRLILLFITFGFIGIIPLSVSNILPYSYLTQIYGKGIVSILPICFGLFHLLVSSIIYIGFAYIVEVSIQGKIPTLANTMQYAFSRLKNVLWTTLFFSVILLGLVLLLVFPAIIWGTYYSFALIIAALRNVGGKVALDLSKKMVQGQWWRIFYIRFIIGIVSLCINLPILIISRKVFEIKFLSAFIPLTISSIIGAIGLVMFVVLFLNVEYMRDSQKQNQIAKSKRT